MASLVKDLIEAGIHFGHRATNWNPKMAPYIYGKRNKIHIIDVKQTVKGLLLARKLITNTVGRGKDILFVGTKRQARGKVEQYASEVNMPYVIERWLGGTLTNFRTIRERLKRLEELEKLEETGEINTYSKKMESQLRREKEKIRRNLEGIRHMTKLPGAVVVIDCKREVNAVREAKKLNIPTICLLDTDSDPDFADIPIPGNDDAIRSIEVVVKSLCAAVSEGKSGRLAAKEGNDPQDQGQTERRRSRRAQFRSDEPEDSNTDAPKADASSDAAPAAEPAAEPVSEPAVAESLVAASDPPASEQADPPAQA
jgi:small subunit ribosomal protein S2